MPIQRTDFTGLTDMYVDTAKYQLDPAFQNYMLQDPKDIDQKRLNGYRYFMLFYKGNHWDQRQETNPAFGWTPVVEQEYNRRTWNIAKTVVDKLVAFMAKEPWSIKLASDLEEAWEEEQDSNDAEDDEPDKNPVYKTLESVWYANNKQSFTYKMVLMGMITGDVFIKLSYDEDFYAEGVGELKIEVLDSRFVLPYFDAQDRDKLIGARIRYLMPELQSDGSTKSVVYTEIHTESTIATFIDGEVDNIAPNPLGELLIIHVRNEPLPYERFGRSALYDLIVPNKEYNEKVSDLSEILAYHAAPITVVKGARVNTIEKGARKVWGGIPKDGDVYNLNLEADLSSTLQYLENLKTHMHEVSGVPAETLGQVQSISNTSGSALHIQYQPILDRIQPMQIEYGKGIRKINELIIKFYEAVGALELPMDMQPALKYKTTIKWGDALPRDRSIDLSDISTEMGLGIESKHGALKRLGVENPDAKLKEIQDETLEQASLDFATTGLQGFGDPQAGPDGMGGTSAGANDGPQNDVSGAVAQSKTNPTVQGNDVTTQAVKKSAQTTTGANKNR